MDFKSILSKLDSMEAPVVVPAVPELPKAVQLNEDAQLRVLAGQSSYIAEAKKKAEEKKEEEMEEGFDADSKVGDTFTTGTGGTATKTKTGVKHTAGKNYGAQKQPFDKDDDDKPAKKVSKKVKEAAKPDFLDMDKDGDKKEPMKKAVADKKKGAVGKKVEEGKDEGKPGKNFAKIAKSAGEKYGSKEAGERVAGAVRKKVLAKESKEIVAESVEKKLTFKECIQLVRESGGQQQIDAVDKELFAWAQRVAASKFNEGVQQDAFAGLTYERMGGRFELYDVLSETKE